MSVTVRPDGKITGPLFEDLPALGKDPTSLARDIEKVLAKYIRDPVVTVIVGGFVGPYPEQIRVIGEAAKPQALSYRQGMTLLDLMIAVGGLTDFADGNKATIMRTSEGRQAIFRAAQGPGQARGHFRERRRQARRHSPDPAELVLMAIRSARRHIGKYCEASGMQELVEQLLQLCEGHMAPPLDRAWRSPGWSPSSAP